MKIGLCTSVENGAVALDAGFDYLEGSVQQLLVAQQPDEAFASNLKAIRSSVLPVPVANMFLPGALKCVGPDVDLRRLDHYATTVFRRAGEAGIGLIVFGSGGARSIPEGFSRERAHGQVLDFLRRVLPAAETFDVLVVLECLNTKECNFINSLAEGAAIVAEIDHPNFRLLADIYHMTTDGEPASEIIKYAHLLRHVHVAEKEGRQAPGTGGEDFGPYLRALKEINYQGALSFECSWKSLPGQAAASLKGFREQVRQAGLA